MKPYFIIDPGHGKMQAGKRSPVLEDGRQFLEWKNNWEVAEILLQKIKQSFEIDGCMSLQVSKEKAGRMLEERVKNINNISTAVKKHNYVPICISIHSNAFTDTWSPPSGIETYYYRHVSQPDEKRNIGRRYALIFQKHLVDRIGFKDRNVKPNNTFYILKNTICTTVLTETGFYTNRNEVEKMLSSSFPMDMAEAHYDAMLEISKKI